MIITCDKWKAYSQTIKQLIAFDRRHIWSVKVTQAEKYYLIISGSTSSFFVELTGDFRKKIMLICTCLKLGGKDAGNNINCSLSHLNVNEKGFVYLGACARRHTLEPSQHNIFQKHGLISIYWSATKHNFNWNDNAWMARFSLSKNSKNSTPRGGQNFFEGWKHHNYLLCTSINTNVGEMTARRRQARARPGGAICSHWWRMKDAPPSSFGFDRLRQVSRSEQGDECHL